MKNKLFLRAISLALISTFICTGCIVPYRVNKADYKPMPDSRADPVGFDAAVAQMDGIWHGILVYPEGATRPKISFFEKFNPIWLLGNLDDRHPPLWYKPGNPLREILWYCRNPFHNLFFYAIGVADKEFVRFGRYPECVFKPGKGWNFAITAYEYIYFPFISYDCSWFRVYFGWRNRGNFGIKINFGREKEPVKKDKANPPPNSG